MAVNSKINIELENLPIGVAVYHWLGSDTGNSRLITWLNEIYNNIEWYCLSFASSQLFLESDYPNIYIWTSSTTTNTRAGLGFDGTNWIVYNTQLLIAQRTLNGSSFTNIQIARNYTRNITATSNSMHSNFANNKTVIINFFVGCGYQYTEDNITWNFAFAPIVNATSRTILSRPYVSGNVYSFYDNRNAKRIYTTDHITFIDCTGFGVSDLQIQRMSNGWLYTTTGTSLRVSTDNGITWTSRTLPATVVTAGAHNLDTNGTTHVFCAGSNGLWSTTDFITWTPRTSNIAGTNSNIRVYFANALFIVGSGTASTTSISTSTDGITWTNQTLPNSDILNAFGYCNALYMILANGRVFTSPTGVTWTSSIANGNNEDDISIKGFHTTGTKACFVSAGVTYFYNAGTWTTVATNQQTTGLRMPLSFVLSPAGTFVKLR